MQFGIFDLKNGFLMNIRSQLLLFSGLHAQHDTLVNATEVLEMYFNNECKDDDLLTSFSKVREREKHQESNAKKQRRNCKSYKAK
jgi:hypothetical protein